jgi:hypothetical protein
MGQFELVISILAQAIALGSARLEGRALDQGDAGSAGGLIILRSHLLELLVRGLGPDSERRPLKAEVFVRVSCVALGIDHENSPYVDNRSPRLPGRVNINVGNPT